MSREVNWSAAAPLRLKESPCTPWRPEKKIRNNILYLANLVALREWYERIRGLFFERSELAPR